MSRETNICHININFSGEHTQLPRRNASRDRADRAPQPPPNIHTAQEPERCRDPGHMVLCRARVGLVTFPFYTFPKVSDSVPITPPPWTLSQGADLKTRSVPSGELILTVLKLLAIILLCYYSLMREEGGTVGGLSANAPAPLLRSPDCLCALGAEVLCTCALAWVLCM